MKIYLPSQGMDFWTPGKRLLMDPSFLDKLSVVTDDSVTDQKVRMIRDEVLPHADWDPFQSGKTFPPAETICLWISALCLLHSKRKVGEKTFSTVLIGLFRFVVI